MDGRMGGGYLGRTVENPADETPSEICLLGKVPEVWDVWSIRMIGPGVLLRVGLGPDVY